ncbi:MAG TPA: hypothetical protein ENK02_15815 [Planctomycetes bacterium]|nr:hypothetical protein [Planctomycetota bacterium]
METERRIPSPLPTIGILPLLLGLGSMQGLQPEPGLPAFDLAARQADLVLVLRPRAREGDRVLCKVLKSFGNPPPSGELVVLEPRALPRPQTLQNGGAQLAFLRKAAGTGNFLLLQHPGTLVPWTEKRRRELEPLLQVLLRKTGPKGRASALLSLALENRPARTRALALLTLCREGGMRYADQGQRRLLLQLLKNRSAEKSLRDVCARALAGAGDRELPALMLRLLQKGEAKGLGPCFGNLLRQMLGTALAKERLQSALRGNPTNPDLRAALGG